MLIYQGIIAYELFTDTKLPDDIGERIKRRFSEDGYSAYRFYGYG